MQGLICGSAGAPEDLEQLVDLRVPWEQRPLVHHLRKDAAHGPDVDGGRVVAGAQQDLRRAVPEGHHLHRQRGRRSDGGGSWGETVRLNAP